MLQEWCDRSKIPVNALQAYAGHDIPIVPPCVPVSRLCKKVYICGVDRCVKNIELRVGVGKE